MTVFLLVAAVGLAIALLRPPVYRSVASLVIVPPAQILTGSQVPTMTESIAQQALVQRQLLLGQPTLGMALEQVRDSLAPGTDPVADVSELRERISVTHLPDTRILELAAEGDDPERTSKLVNAWLDVYVEKTQSTEADSFAANRVELERQIEELADRIVVKRAELDEFRDQHDIVSMERAENQSLAKLKGLTASLNTVNEEQIAAEARLRALQEARALGRPIVPPNEQRQIIGLEERVVDLEQQLGDLGKEYTEAYLALNPNVNTTKRQIAMLRDKITAKTREAEEAALSEAEQAVSSSNQSVVELQRQLDEHRSLVSNFSARFAEYEALQQELAQLETVHRETQDRLLKTQVAQANVAPRAEVLERAYPNSIPISPDYFRDGTIAVGAALLVGLLAVWMQGFLMPPAPTNARFDARIFASSLPGTSREDALPPGSPAQRLEHTMPRELSTDEARLLVQQATDDRDRALILFLLSGLTLEEATSLRWEGINFKARTIRVGGTGGRKVKLTDALAATLRRMSEEPVKPHQQVLAEPQGPPTNSVVLADRVSSLARDAGLVVPERIDPAALRHTYVAYLVRQGARLTEIDQIVGSLATHETSAYGVIAPPGTGVALDRINLIYPATTIG